MAGKKPGPKRRHSGQWKPGESGNPAGRPPKDKSKNQLSDDLLNAAEGTFTYYDEEQKLRRVKKSEFISGLIISALTTGMFVFYPTTHDGVIREVPVDSAEIIRLVNFYFSRLEGTPTKKEDDSKDEVKGADVTEEELDEIRSKRWEGALDQIEEALGFDEEDSDQTE